MEPTLETKIFYVLGHPVAHAGRMHIHAKNSVGERARKAKPKNLGVMAGKAVDACANTLREGVVGRAMTMFGMAQGLRDMVLRPDLQAREGCEFEDLVPISHAIKARMGEVVDALIPYVKSSNRKPWYVKYGGVQPKI
jgi:hypothetical protein